MNEKRMMFLNKNTKYMCEQRPTYMLVFGGGVSVCVSAIKIRLRVRLLLYVCNAYTNWHSIASAPFI